MRTIMRFSWLALLVVGLSAPAALAGKAAESAKPQDGSMTIDDKAGIFTASGVDTATAKFNGVTFKARTHFAVVTRGAVPEAKKAEFEATKGDKSKLNSLFDSWARELAKDRSETGVFVLVYVRGEKNFVKAITDKASDVHRHFTDSDCSALEKKLFMAIDASRKQTGDEAKKTSDSGLLEGTSFVIDQLKDTSLPADTKLKSDQHKETGGMSILSWVCIIGAVLLGVWLLIALMRMMTGGVQGYGGGYGGGGGGGGMGFMGGLMGGMFGAMAGMYLYDQFTGGHHYNDNYGSGSDNYGGGGDNYGGSQDTGEGNFDGGASGEGAGNWGDSGDSGGGADTGGGGDWGGDSGGGGDFGGGGDW